MIAFASCVGSAERFRRWAGPGISRFAEPDSVIAEVTTSSSIFEAYNEVLDALRPRGDLEALVLLHDDTEITDPRFCAKVRDRLAEPDVAIVGVVGARAIDGLAWWKGETFGRVRESRGLVDFGDGTHDVDVVDGLLLVLSRWAVDNLRFDEERFSGFHAYDLDICLQARAAGRRVVVDDLDVFHHTKGGYGDESAFRRAERTWRAKWSDRVRPAAEPIQVACRLCGREFGAERTGTPAVVTCPACGVGITIPEPERDIATDEIFEGQYGGNRLAMRPQWFKEAEVRLDWIGRFVPQGTILEVGAATGEFVASATMAGYRAVGLEPSLWAAAEARRLGVESVEPVTLDEWRRRHPERSVDAVALFHVLEHVNEPHAFLRSVLAVLRPGGKLFVEVPNFASSAARADPVRWTGVAIDEHVLHYTPAALERLLSEAGFTVVERAGHTYRLYDSPEVWAARRRAWLASGLVEPAEDLLRAVAMRPEGGGPAERG